VFKALLPASGAVGAVATAVKPPKPALGAARLSDLPRQTRRKGQRPAPEPRVCPICRAQTRRKGQRPAPEPRVCPICRARRGQRDKGLRSEPRFVRSAAPDAGKGAKARVRSARVSDLQRRAQLRERRDGRVSDAAHGCSADFCRVRAAGSADCAAVADALALVAGAANGCACARGNGRRPGRSMRAD
jgi:hypothetical protein